MSENPSSPTGLGNITRFVCGGLADFGHHVSIIGGPKQGRLVRFRRYTVYPAGNYKSDARAFLAVLERLRPDVLITLSDPQRLSHIAEPTIHRFLGDNRIPWVHYCAIDSDMGKNRLPNATLTFLRRADLLISASHYNCRLLGANGLSAEYIPHGVDTTIFCPPPDKARAKRALGYDNKFIILSDARNQIRKLWPRTLDIFRRFAAGKDDVVLHLHCDPYDYAADLAEYRYDILADVQFLKLGEKVRFTRGFSCARGISLSRLAALYQSADVHLLASYGEGFGIPTLQAASAGVVPFAVAYSASHELVRGHGEPIRVRRYVQADQGMRRALIDVDEAVARLERLYRDRALLKSKSEASRRFAEAYSWSRLMPEWHEYLNRTFCKLRAGSRTSIGQSLLTEGALARGRNQNNKFATPPRVNGSDGSAGASAAARHDFSGSRMPFTIPVTPPLTNSALVTSRVSGRVYVAGAADILVFRELKRIFPRLSAWSTTALDLSSTGMKGSTFEVVPRTTPDFQTYLDSSILALDLGCSDTCLPVVAATAGVPLVGLSRNPDQKRLWPGLTLKRSNVRAASEKGRLMLTDHGAVLESCALARRLSNRTTKSGSLSITSAQP
jgi:glycosyltransferase involved in cell wall biosynthesis